MRLRLYTGDDLPGVIRLTEAECWPSFTGDPERAHRALTAPGVVTVVAVEGDALLGFAQRAAGAARGATLQFNPSNDEIGDAFAWDPSSASVGASAGPFEAIEPVSLVEVDDVTDDADSTVKDLESAASSRTLNDALRGETDVVSVMGSATEPSIWTWMLAGFDRLGAAIRRIAAST